MNTEMYGSTVRLQLSGATDILEIKYDNICETSTFTNIVLPLNK